MSQRRSFAIVPAAGRSKRMGQDKLLLPWGKITVIQHVLAAWKASQISRVVVVLRPADDALAAVCRHAGVDVVVPTTAPPEMKVSIQHGLRHVEQVYRPEASDAWLLAPADMPGLSPRTIDLLISAHRSQTSLILAPSWGGRRGHPVLFPWPFGQDVYRLGDDEGVNVLLGRHAVREIVCSEGGIPDDLDTPDDYRRLLERETPS